MDIKKKILLGEKDILSKDNEDLFLNINLNSTFSSIRNDKFENVFDVEKQFKKERNSSTNFRIYGMIDATITDCDNITINIFSQSGTTGLSGFIKTTTSTGLAYNGINVYGKKRGKFVIDLDEYHHDFVYLEIPSNFLNYKTQIYSQQVIFKDADGNFVGYGTRTIDVDEEGNAIEINNDFYYLYNKHWIKKDLLIIEEKPANVFINSSEDLSETNELSTIADRITIDISLDKPSPFGLERTDLNALTSTLSSNEIIITDAGNTLLPLPHTVAFAPGEQHKILYFYSPLDNLQEFVEDVVLGLENFVNVGTGQTLQHTIKVADKTPRNKVRVNFQSVFQNRNYFTGRVYDNGSNRQSFQMPSVLRNGLFFEGTPMEFYPSDNYTLKIKNVGVDTVMPINAIFGITAEQLFLANQELTFNITQKYTNIEKNSIKLTFKNLNAPTNPSPTQYYSLNDGIRLSAVPFVKYGYNFKVSYNNFLAYLNGTIPPGLSITIDGWSYANLERPFDISADAANLTITITAKNTGTRLDLTSYGTFPDLFDLDPDTFDVLGVKAEIVQEFVHGNQIPLEFDLSANMGNNFLAQYQFTISKIGYDTMAFTCSPMQADPNPDTFYLVSGLNTILRNWNDSTSSTVFMHEHVTSNWGNNANSSSPTFGAYKIGDVYINGMVLVANRYLSNTTNYSNEYGQQALNTTHAINSSGDLSHDLYPEPIAVIPETVSELSVSNISQYGYLAILKPHFPGTTTNPPAGVAAERSFDFRTGATGAYNTYYTNDYYNYGGVMWNSTAAFSSSGGTIASTNSTTTRTLKALLETGQATPFITAQGVQGVGASLPAAFYSEFVTLFSSSNSSASQNVEGHNALSVIRLESQTPGNPFEITNIKELRYLSGPNAGLDFTKGSIVYIEARPNQTVGVTLNKGNNKMGGFSVTHP